MARIASSLGMRQQSMRRAMAEYPMTSAERAALQKMHRPNPPLVTCFGCDLEWPCEVAEVLAELERVETERDGRGAVLDAYKAHHAHFHAGCNIDGPARMPPKPEVIE
jgi:hypothetical protein